MTTLFALQDEPQIVVPGNQKWANVIARNAGFLGMQRVKEGFPTFKHSTSIFFFLGTICTIEILVRGSVYSQTVAPSNRLQSPFTAPPQKKKLPEMEKN